MKVPGKSEYWFEQKLLGKKKLKKRQERLIYRQNRHGGVTLDIDWRTKYIDKKVVQINKAKTFIKSQIRPMQILKKTWVVLA